MTRPTFGFINTFENPESWLQPWDVKYQEIIEQICWIDRDLQIDSAEVSEHHFYEDGYLSTPMSMSAVLAAKTSRLRIGTNLVQLPLHDPVRLAEEALFVDALSGGRFRLGVGMGYSDHEFMGMGVKLETRRGRFEEGVEILRRAFTGEPFTFQGRHHNLDKMRVTPGPLRPGGPPIWIGARLPVAVERAARLGDGYLAFDLSTFGTYLDAAKALGKPENEQRLNATYWAVIADDPEREFARVGQHFMHLMNAYIGRGVYANRPKPLTVPFSDPQDALASGHLLLTDAAGAIERFDADVDAGVTDFSFVTTWPGEPIDQVSQRIQYFNDKVLPFVKHPLRG